MNEGRERAEWLMGNSEVVVSNPLHDYINYRITFTYKGIRFEGWLRDRIFRMEGISLFAEPDTEPVPVLTLKEQTEIWNQLDGYEFDCTPACGTYGPKSVR